MNTFALALLIGIAVGGSPAGTASATHASEEPRVAAAGAGATVSFAELDDALLVRNARTPETQEALLHLVGLRVLEVLSKERNVRVEDRVVEARWRELEREVVADGGAGGMHEYLERQGVDSDEFRSHLRLAIVQERLTRRDLGMGDDAPLTAEHQRMWLDRVLADRGFVRYLPPYENDVVASCAGVTIRPADLARELRRQVPRDEVRALCAQLLMRKKLESRLEGVTTLEERQQAVSAEVLRRKALAEADPKYQGMLTFTEILEAQGIWAQRYPGDPVVRVAALSRLAVEREWNEERLRAHYDSERERFDARHGEGVETRVLFLRAAERVNDLNPRDFAAAEQQLAALAPRISGRAAFEALARELSDDRVTRESGGRIGVVTRGAENVPAELREAVFEALARGTYAPDSGSDDAAARLVGPLRTKGGVALLWLGEYRAKPDWDTMRTAVVDDARRLLLEELLPPDSIRVWFDEVAGPGPLVPR